MKYTILFGFAVLVGHSSYGQKTEYSAHLNSGLFSYRGASATTRSSIIVSDRIEYPTRTENVYGKRPGISYGLAGQLQRITRKHSLLGVQAGYEVLRSRVTVDRVFASTAGTYTLSSASGHTNLASHFVNVHPFFGHRFSLKAIDLDLTLGPDISFLRGAREKGEADTGSEVVKTDIKRNRTLVDTRARVNLTAFYQRVGLTAGYSYGLRNYFGGYDGGTNDLYTQMFRLGAVYRFN